MEVLLKKTKITLSILKQTLKSNEFDLIRGEVLGWCIAFREREKYIVIYRHDTNELSKFKFSLSDLGNDFTSKFSALLIRVSNQAIMRGQFFI